MPSYAGTNRETVSDKPVETTALARTASRALRTSGLSRLSSIYVLVVIVLIFWRVLQPGAWFSTQNLSVILTEASVIGLLAVAAVIPLSASLFDISFANIAGFSMGFTAYLALHTSLNTWLIAVFAVGASTAFGLLSGVLVALLQLPSLIVTLGTSSVALAVTQFMLDGQTLYPRSRLTPGFLSLGNGQWGPIPESTVLLAVIGLIAWAWIEHTPSGRRLLALGGDANAARIAGVRSVHYQILCLTLSALLSGIGGVVLLATIGTADDVSASAYLLPVIAAIFLGSTQVKSRFNVAGTFLAVILIQTGIHGIELEGLSQWVNYVFDGAVLIVAVVVSRRSSKYAF